MRAAPQHLQADLARAVRLEWWTLGWQASIIIVMGVVLGSSQAMKTAWIDDALGLVPAAVFLIALRFERKPPNRKFPFGFQRTNSMAFLASASVLSAMGLYLLYDSAAQLIAGEHPTIEPVELFGETVWMGWLMIAALIYSIIPPLILGRLKHPLAKRLQDKVLHTDALMQKADWMTGLAAIVGIAGVGYGLWWADAAAAGVIACDIAGDGVRAARVAVAELLDGMPRALESSAIAEDALRLQESLARHFPGADVRLRETGRYIAAEVRGVAMPPEPLPLAAYWTGDPDRAWRFTELTFSP